ncbi:MAG: YxeA family protein [Clostridiales bacterium]|nr:YxeA family protein [Clostridiales bacterium]
MKRKPVFLTIAVIAIVLVAIVALWGKQYYEDRYVGADYYAMVPPSFDATPEMMYSMSGGEVGLGKEYVLTAYDEHGEAREVEFNVYVDRSSLPQPGAFLHISASKQLVVRWRLTDADSIPEAALAQLSTQPN